MPQPSELPKAMLQPNTHISCIDPIQIYRSSAEGVKEPVTCDSLDIPAATPLRRPHSPAKKSPREPPVQPASESTSERKGKILFPPSVKHAAHQQTQQEKGNQSSVRNVNPTTQERQNRNQAPNVARIVNQGGQNRNQISNVRGNRNQNDDGRNLNQSGRDNQDYQPLRRPMKINPEPKPPMEPPQMEPKPKMEPKTKVDPKPEVEPKPAPAPVEIKAESAKPASKLGSLGDVTPRKALVPASFVVETLSVGATFVSEVFGAAQASGSQQAGCVCLTLHDQSGDMYEQLCEPLKELCENDTEVYTPCIGETFAYLYAEDGYWYRARCLARTRAALLDTGRVVSLAPSAARRLPAAFANIPEFTAVINSKQLNAGDQMTCTVVNAGSNIRVLIQHEAGNTEEVDAARWLPDIEYPAEPERPMRQLEQPILKPEVKTAPAPVEPKKIEPTPEVKTIEAKVPERPPVVPTRFVVETLSVGATFVSEVFGAAQASGSQQAGCVCLTLHDQSGDMYEQLCEPLKELCENDTEVYTPCIGETFAYLYAEDGYWYRARCLARTRAALLDTGRVVSLAPSAARRLPAAFANIPEFTAVFNTDALTVGNHYNCRVLSVTNGIRVAIDDVSGKLIEFDATRWQPDVEYPKPVSAVSTAPKPVAVSKSAAVPQSTAVPNIPEVPRPPVEHNSLYILLDVTSLHRACVRPSDNKRAAMFDSVLHDTLLYAVNAKPLKEPPQIGQTVVAKFTGDDSYYRAFVKRMNVPMNKYLIQYIEYGNEETVTLDRLYACPPKLQIDARPTEASLIKLTDRQEPTKLTSAAVSYIDKLRDNAIELILTIPGGAKSAPSGSVASLLVAKNCEPASKRIEELCTPEWMKLAQRGGDVLEMEPFLYEELPYLALPTDREFTLRVTHCNLNLLASGILNGYEKGDKRADYVFGELSKEIEEYCKSSLCREPYLPKIEELCIVKHNITGAWLRGALMELAAGSASATVLIVDLGEIQETDVTNIRRMPRELAAYPATGMHCEIQDFPCDATRAQLSRVARALALDEAGAGELHVRACRAIGPYMYILTAPELLAALEQ